MSEKDVTLVNYFFWNSCASHFKSYNPEPLNIQNICVFYHNRYMLKRAILKYVMRLKKLKRCKYFNNGSIKKKNISDSYIKVLRLFLKIRKHHKYIN